MSRYVCVVLMLLALPATAEVSAPVKDETQFRSLVSGRELRLGMFGVSLIIGNDGTISGNAMGSPVTGAWSWRDGYFCRDMHWSGTDLDYNCQLVEVIEGPGLRFTADKGAGRAASFDLR